MYAAETAQAPGDATIGRAVSESAPALLHYTLPPEKLQQALALYRIDVGLSLVTTIYVVMILWLMLRTGFGVRLDGLARHVSRFRIVQAAIAISVFVATLEVLRLPLAMYGHHVSLQYGLSVQRWGSWFGDWAKGLLLTCVAATLLGAILYAMLRRSPRRWWLYFWVATVPFVVLLIFVAPVWIDPLFNKFEPLIKDHAELVEQIERVVRRAGLEIPRTRMFLMKASEKTTELNAYVTGFGATKRVVVWDTTTRHLSTPETLFVFGHELGHYVLGHIVKETTLILLVVLGLYYMSYRLLIGLMASYGRRWGIAELGDWASLPLVALTMVVLSFGASPLLNGISRHFEHQADQYGVEVIHGLVPDEHMVAAKSFQVLGERSLDYPYVGKLVGWWFWDHPTIADRMVFVQTYDPWRAGQKPQFVSTK